MYIYLSLLVFYVDSMDLKNDVKKSEYSQEKISNNTLIEKLGSIYGPTQFKNDIEKIKNNKMVMRETYFNSFSLLYRACQDEIEKKFDKYKQENSTKNMDEAHMIFKVMPSVIGIPKSSLKMIGIILSGEIIFKSDVYLCNLIVEKFQEHIDIIEKIINHNTNEIYQDEKNKMYSEIHELKNTINAYEERMKNTTTCSQFKTQEEENKFIEYLNICAKKP